MKTAEELEQELISLSRELCAISVAIAHSAITYYINHKEFRSKLDEFIDCFVEMHEVAERESYFWRYCSFDLFTETLEKQIDSLQPLSLDKLGVFLYDTYSELTVVDRYPLLTEKLHNNGHTDYRFHFSGLAATLLGDWQLQKDLRNEMYKKQERVDYLRKKVNEALDAERDRESCDEFLSSLGIDGLSAVDTLDEIGDGAKPKSELTPSLAGVIFYYVRQEDDEIKELSIDKGIDMFQERYSFNFKCKSMRNAYYSYSKAVVSLLLINY
jgi:hypothetical protein